MFRSATYAAIAVSLVSGLAAQGQDAQPITVDVQLVVLHATVTDRRGMPVSGLQKRDFQVYEDGKLQTVRLFQHEDVPVAVTCCPECGGAFGEARQEMVSTTDIPARPQPEVQLYAVEIRQCKGCGRKVRGQHPGIAPGQQGATAHRIGPRVKALAHVLHYLHGVPVRKTPAIIEDLTGVRLTQGADPERRRMQTLSPDKATYSSTPVVGRMP